MATKARVGLIIPSAFAGPLPKPREFAAFFRAADRLGFHSLWIIERFLHTSQILHTFTTLTWAAALTKNIKVATGVALAVFHNPILLAKMAATMDYLSGGRLILGLSLGGRPEEFPAFGISPRQRRGRLEETITILRKLWTEPRVTFQGRYFKLEGVTVAPRPATPQGIPIILGTAAEPGLRRAATMADGWIAGSGGTPEAMKETWQMIAQFAKEAGRNPDTLDAAKLLYMNVDDDKDRARERLEPFIRGYYGERFDVDRFCVFGPPQECAQGIQRYLDAGIKTIALGLPWPDVRLLERVANEVVPKLS